MPAVTHDLRSLAPDARLAAKAEALRQLGAGAVVVMPADTGYLVCAAAGMPAALDLAKTATAAADGSAVWLAPSTESMTSAVGGLGGLHAKIVRMLSPGPVVFAVHLSEAAMTEARGRLGVAPGIIDSEGAIRVRVPGVSVAATLAGRAETAICCWELLDASGRAFAAASEAATAAETAGLNPGMILSDGTPTGGGSRGRPTVVSLMRTGNIRVLREGAYETRYVMKQATLNILFVCTGNTCRSPMAEAIAAGLVARRGKSTAKAESPVVHISSAGVGASHGSPRTAEGSKALRSRGFEPAPGASRPLTRQMIAEADRIYTMTRSHLDGVLALDPSAKGRASTLDPSGNDIPDPIGLAQEAYNDVAGRLEGLIQERLKEWMP